MKHLRKFIILITIICCLVITTACDSSTNSTTNTDTTSSKAVEQTEYKIGDTWTVADQWSLKVTGVKATNDRNEFSEKKPGAVYIIDYEYTNIGWTEKSGYQAGLFIDFDGAIVDSKGIVGNTYPLPLDNNPKETPVGATCKAQSCIGVENAGNFKITIGVYDSENENQSATFSFSVE